MSVYKPSSFEVNENVHPYWNFIHEANELHIKQSAKYRMLLDKLQSDGVNFGDIQKRMINIAKKDGIYLKNWKNEDNGEMEFRAFSALVKNSTAWAVALQNFLNWKSNNFTAYGVEKEATDTVKKPKTKETFNIPGLGEIKLVVNVSDSVWEAIKSHIVKTAPVNNELSEEQVRSLYVMQRSTMIEYLADDLEESDDPIVLPGRDYTIGKIGATVQ